jgi:hypothetical protein
VARIKVAPRVVEERRKVTLALPVSLLERLDAYARYLGGKTDRQYVVEQVLEQFLNQDREFSKWLERNGSASRQGG